MENNFQELNNTQSIPYLPTYLSHNPVRSSNFPLYIGQNPCTPQILFSLATLARLGSPCTIKLKGITLTKALDYVVNEECMERYTTCYFYY